MKIQKFLLWFCVGFSFIWFFFTLTILDVAGVRVGGLGSFLSFFPPLIIFFVSLIRLRKYENTGSVSRNIADAIFSTTFVFSLLFIIYFVYLYLKFTNYYGYEGFSFVLWVFVLLFTIILVVSIIVGFVSGMIKKRKITQTPEIISR